MCGSVGIAADNGHSREGESPLRTYHVDDSVAAVHHSEMCQPEFGGIGRKGVNLAFRHRVGNRLVLIPRRSVVVRHAVYLFRPETAYSPGPQSVESLRTRDLVAIQPVDIELGRAAVNHVDHVGVPDFVK